MEDDVDCDSDTYRVVQKNSGHHAVCEDDLRKLLLSNGFILVECKCQR